MIISQQEVHSRVWESGQQKPDPLSLQNLSWEQQDVADQMISQVRLGL